MSSGSVEYELELGVPASEAWDFSGTLRFPLSLLVKGDGVVGTVVKITLAPGTLDLSPCKDRFTNVDNEKRIKELEVTEGGPLELGFTMFRVRSEVIEKCEESSIIKSTIEYKLQQEDQVAANSSSAPSLAPAVTAPTPAPPTLPAPPTPAPAVAAPTPNTPTLPAPPTPAPPTPAPTVVAPTPNTPTLPASPTPAPPTTPSSRSSTRSSLSSSSSSLSSSSSRRRSKRRRSWSRSTPPPPPPPPPTTTTTTTITTTTTSTKTTTTTTTTTTNYYYH